MEVNYLRDETATICFSNLMFTRVLVLFGTFCAFAPKLQLGSKIILGVPLVHQVIEAPATGIYSIGSGPKFLGSSQPVGLLCNTTPIL